MVGTIDDLNKSMNSLAPTFRTAINATIQSESLPLTRTQTQRDQVTVRRSIYTDMKNNLDALQTATQALISTQGSFGLNLTPSPSIIVGTAGTNVLTATVSDTAIYGDYDFSVTKLAKAETKGTAAVASSDIALGKSGTFWIGGIGVPSIADFTAGDSVTAVNVSDVLGSQRELGTGSYSVQVRESEGTRQFRLVNADGNAVSILSRDGSSYSTGWQNMATDSASYNTGRGLTLTLDSTGAVGNTSLTYTAKGASISISASDTQRTIASMINATSQPEGRDFKASVVAGKLLLTGSQTGVNHTLVYQDDANLGFTSVQTAQNAEFTVNGMAVNKASNSGLTDIVDGTTINLASDAEGKTARLSIASNSNKASAAMTSFVSAFNAAYTHITNKMAITSTTTGDKTTYSRSPLTGDNVFRSLRAVMYNQVANPITNSGSFKSLSEIGLSFDSNMKLTLDSTKFADVLKNKGSDLTALMDAAMGQFNTTISTYSGSSGSLQNSVKSIDDQIKGLDVRISKHQELLNSRKQSLVDQYLGMQTQLAQLGYEAQMFGISLTGGSSSGVNILG